MFRSTVVVLHATPETIVDDVRRALHLADAESIVGSERPKWIEVETGRGILRPGSCTMPWQLDAVLRRIDSESSEPPLVDIPRGARRPRASGRVGLDRILRERVRAAAEPPVPEGVAVDPELALPLLTSRRGDLARVDPRRLGRDAILLPPLRRSRRWGLRGAVDLAVSTLGEEAERASGAATADLVSELFALHRHLHPRTASLIDVTVCGAEDLRDAPSLQNLLIASTDAVAADAVGARLLGLEASRLPWLRACAARGLGHAEAGAIRVVGEDIESLEGGILGRTWRPRSEAGRRGPVARISAALHSALIIPVADRLATRPVWKHYARTPWGRLLDDYRKGEVPWA